MNNIFANEGVSLARLLSLQRVVDAGSIAGAASGDPNVQSQLSRQIADLEKAMEFPLLDRSKKPYSPSTEAVSVADACRRFVADVQHVVDAAGGLQRPISVGAGEIVIREFLIPMIGQTGKGPKIVKWDMRNLKGSKIQEGLAAEWLDIGIGSGLMPDGQVRVEELSSYGFKLILPSKIKSDSSGWVKLADLPLAMLDGDPGYKRFITEQAREAGVELTIGAECTSFAQAVSLAKEAGWAVFVPDYWWAREKTWAQRTHELPGLDSFSRKLQLGWNSRVRERRPEVDRLIKGMLKKR